MKFYSSEHTLHERGKMYSLSTESFTVDYQPTGKEPHQGTARIAELGAISLAKITCNSAIVKRHKDRLSEASDRRYTFYFILEGHLRINHQHGTNELSANHLILFDNSHARTLYVKDRVTMITINVPEQDLRRFIPKPEDFTGLLMQPELPADQALINSITSCWGQVRRGVMDEFAKAIADTLLNSIASFYAARRLAGSKKSEKRIACILNLIEDNLDNPDFNVRMLADKAQISERYLRTLFAEREKISRYILRRRLEQCAQQMVDPHYQNISITSIAFEWGFNSSAHFSRAFKQQFGKSPRQYRASYQLFSAGQQRPNAKTIIPSHEDNPPPRLTARRQGFSAPSIHH